MNSTFGRESHPCSCEICGTDVEDGNLATYLSSFPEWSAVAADSEGFWRTLGMLCSLLPAALLADALTLPGEASAVSDSKRRVASLRAVSCGC